MAHAGTATLASGVLTYQAGAGETNRVFVVQDTGGMHVIDTGAAVTAGAGCTQEAPNEAFCAAADPTVLTIDVNADDMSDYVDLRPAALYFRSALNGGSGDDELFGGNAAEENLFDGGPGGDTFSGHGTVDYSTRTNPVTVTIGDNLANDGEAGEGDNVPSEITRVVGGDAADTMTALNANNVGALTLVGGPGADHLTYLRQFFFGVLEGKQGDDELRIGDTEGLAHGGDGEDLLVGGHASQSLDGEAGNDDIRGNAGNDRLIGGAGADEITGGPAKDSISAGKGTDTIFARDHKRDVIDGGPGEDKARVDAGLDKLISVEHTF